MELTIHTHDSHLAFDILEASNFAPGVFIDAPGGFRVTAESLWIRRSFGIPEVLTFVIDAAKDIDIALFTYWLTSKLKDKPVVSIAINKKVIATIEEGDIRLVLEEEIRQD